MSGVATRKRMLANVDRDITLPVALPKDREVVA